MPSNFSLLVANEEGTGTSPVSSGAIKFHLIKGIRSPLTRDVLLDDSGGGGIRERKRELARYAIAWRKRRRGREMKRTGGGDGDEGGGSAEWNVKA